MYPPGYSLLFDNEDVEEHEDEFDVQDEDGKVLLALPPVRPVTDYEVHDDVDVDVGSSPAPPPPPPPAPAPTGTPADAADLHAFNVRAPLTAVPLEVQRVSHLARRKQRRAQRRLARKAAKATKAGKRK